jgi:hypothetical protein
VLGKIRIENLHTYTHQENQVLRYQNWVAGAWENQDRYSYTYDANDNQLEYVFENWTAGAWTACK